MRGGARATHEQVTIARDGTCWPSDMACMVFGVKVLSIPARREEDVRADTSSARSLGKFDGIERAGTRMRVSVVRTEVGTEAAPGNGAGGGAVSVSMGIVADHGISDDHTEALGERRDLLVVGGLDVVDSHASVRATSELVGHLGNSNVASVGILEVQHGRPVIGGIFLELAGGASGSLRVVDARIHRDVEGISTDNLVDVGRHDPGGHQRVEALGYQLGTSETQQSVRCWRNNCQGKESTPLHG